MSPVRSSSWCHDFHGLRADGPLDDAFDVVARAIAPNVGPPELDRRVVGGERDALDEEGGGSDALAEQPGLPPWQEDRLQRLARAHDRRPIARCHQLVERGML